MANEQDLFNPPPDSQGSKNFFVRHWKALAIIVGLLLALLIFTRYIHSKQPVPGPRGGRYSANGQAVSVGTATAVTGDIDVKIPALGTVTPLATVTVRTQISGVMQKILFTEGQLVHQGQVLAQIDPRPYQAAVQQMEGNLKRDQALLADAKLDLVRYENLVKEDSIAQQQLDTQRALVDQYTGSIESDQGQLQTARVNLIYTSVTAPVTGRVGLRQVDQGNYVTPGDTNGIVLINEVQPITVIFTIPEDNVSAIAKRVHDGAQLAAQALDRTNSQKIADGKLLTFDNTIDITTGTIKLRAQFENQDNALFPNQFVNIQLLVDTVKNQVIIPSSAVRRGAPNGVASTFVYVVNQDRTVAVRPVTLGVVDGEREAVLSGLNAGDIVVTEGADRLRDGATVLLPKLDAPASAAPTAPAKAGAPGGQGQHRHQHGSNGRPPQSS